MSSLSRFLLLWAGLAVVTAAALYAVFLQADGYADPYYLRFTTPPQRSLILGTSRAAQGIQPAVLGEVLGRNDLYNFAFTIGTSPYGPAYNELIRRKLADGADSNAVFVLAVDPWSLSVSCPTGPDSLCLEESDRFTGQLRTVSRKPNFDYLLNYYGSPYYRLLLPTSREIELQDDGWLQVNVQISPTKFVANREEKLIPYRRYAKRWRVSDYRLRYLKRLIAQLRQRGRVYLVRLPVDPEMFALEEEYAPGFSDLARRWAVETAAPFLDLTGDNATYQTLDGQHLEQASGRGVSRVIGEWMLEESDRRLKGPS